MVGGNLRIQNKFLHNQNTVLNDDRQFFFSRDDVQKQTVRARQNKNIGRKSFHKLKEDKKGNLPYAFWTHLANDDLVLSVNWWDMKLFSEQKLQLIFRRHIEPRKNLMNECILSYN